MDLVGRPWRDVEERLKAENCKYNTVLTCPSQHKKFTINRDMLYVVRQHINAENDINVVLCAKMGKEV